MIGKRKCVICGKEFIPVMRKQVTCCKECSYENQKRIRREVYRTRKKPKKETASRAKTEHLKWDNDYGKHQIEQTLGMVGKVETNVRAN